MDLSVLLPITACEHTITCSYKLKEFKSNTSAYLDHISRSIARKRKILVAPREEKLMAGEQR